MSSLNNRFSAYDEDDDDDFKAIRQKKIIHDDDDLVKSLIDDIDDGDDYEKVTKYKGEKESTKNYKQIEEDSIQIEDLNLEDEDSEDDSEAIDYIEKIKSFIFSINAKYIVLSVLFILVILTGKGFLSKSPEKERAQNAVQANTVHQVVAAETKTVWDTTAYLDYAEVVELPEDYYTDEMVVTKFKMIDQGTLSFYFSGIPKNFKKKVTFAVSAYEYNSVPSGGKIFIDYKVVSENNTDVITDISTSIKER